MEFSLTDELVHDIIYAMEDQMQLYVFDSKLLKCCLVEESEKDESNKVDDSRYYSLPTWNSASGFRMMEQFISDLHNPAARKELKGILFSGKGVFKNFKKVLHDYPEVEQRWFIYKETQMNKLVRDWYDVLRESWGLEKLSEDIEDLPELVQDGFIFNEQLSKVKSSFIQSIYNQWIQELTEDDKTGFGDMISDISRKTYKSFQKPSFCITAQTIVKEFSGIIAGCPCPPTSKNSVMISVLYVEKKFRGLGVGRELVERCIKLLKQINVNRVVIASLAIPLQFVPVFEQNGFFQMESCYVANLQNDSH